MSTKSKTKEETVSIRTTRGGPLARVEHANGETNGTNGERLRVAKAYKMFVGGEFVRSESGRYFQVQSEIQEADPQTVNIPRGSRKDARDAVLAAKNAEAAWAGRTAFNRGQILYRLAEMMESRRGELETMLVSGGASEKNAVREVDASIDRAMFYAGFSDKFQALLASSNPVAGPHFNFSVTEPMGIIGIVAPQTPSLLGLVSTILPAIVGGNVAIAIASEEDPRTAIVWCECIATSDMPKGVINVLTGQAKEIAPILAKHREVIGMDVWTADTELAATIEKEGADNVKRVKAHREFSDADWYGERSGQGIGYIERFLENKTIWHPVGI
jgi:acyl-CoA reductase-like NAD-dependent aldehyde dehydrogenase